MTPVGGDLGRGRKQDEDTLPSISGSCCRGILPSCVARPRQHWTPRG